MIMEEKQAKQLHYDVMGIALAIRGHEGESDLFRIIDEALTSQNWVILSRVKRGFDLLSREMQADLMSDESDPGEAAIAIRRLERYARKLAGRSARQIA